MTHEEVGARVEHITDYLFDNAPVRAADLVAAIYKSPTGLLNFTKKLLRERR
jgi:hypothetical protein